MMVRRWIGTIAIGLAIAMPSIGFAQDAGGKTTKTHKAGEKTTGKGADKSGKSAGKAADKTKSGAIEPGDGVTDSWITMKLKTDLTNESTLKGSDINVNTKDKVVTLKGTVTSEAGKARAEQIAKGTQGVTKVVDNLTIRAK